MPAGIRFLQEPLQVQCLPSSLAGTLATVNLLPISPTMRSTIRPRHSEPSKPYLLAKISLACLGCCSLGIGNGKNPMACWPEDPPGIHNLNNCIAQKTTSTGQDEVVRIHVFALGPVNCTGLQYNGINNTTTHKRKIKTPPTTQGDGIAREIAWQFQGLSCSKSHATTLQQGKAKEKTFQMLVRHIPLATACHWWHPCFAGSGSAATHSTSLEGNLLNETLPSTLV